MSGVFSGGLDLEVVLLAAGLSRRMGAANKLLMAVGDAPLVRRSAALYSDLGARVIVVLGHEAERVRAALAGLDVAFVENADYAAGQGGSVRRGLAAAAADGDAVALALADQPLLTRDDLEALFGAFAASDRARILIPFFGEARGNPVVLPSALARRIQDDPRNPTCRAFIDANPALCRRFEAQSPGFTTDLDTPEDAARLGLGPTSTEVEP